MNAAPRIVLDPNSGVPPWRQVRDQIVHFVQTGLLPVGSPLPAIRQLAGDLGVAAGTIARVYRELEASGVVKTARRNGTVVAAAPERDRAAELAAAAAKYAEYARSLGADARAAVDAVLAAYED
jgi:GntR family transcriptional regulator